MVLVMLVPLLEGNLCSTYMHFITIVKLQLKYRIVPMDRDGW